MDRAKALRILAEFGRRHVNKPDWEGASFPAQWAFINSPSKLKAVQCSRRSGKSYGCGIYALKEAYETPGVNIVILGLTRDSVKRIFFKDILKAIDSRFGLDCAFNGSDLTATLPNGSIIYLLGADKDEDQMSKLLGQKFKLAIIDESAFFRQDMNKLIYEILKPALIDHAGAVALVSTTSNLTNSLYYDITNGKKGGWDVHKWLTGDNPHMAGKWEDEIVELKLYNPNIEETPAFRRMYLNEWYVDEKGLIYKYSSERNSTPSLPSDTAWRYVLGIDLGYNDASAFVVCAYNDHDPKLYVLDCYSETEMIVRDVALKIQELNRRYNFETQVIDGASKQVVEELKKRYHLPLIIAEKTDKRGYIEMLNSDLITGAVQVLPTGADLLTEWAGLVWDERALEKGKYVEHPACPNHLSDAMLYAWRWVFNYSSKPKDTKIAKGSEAEVEQFWIEQGEETELAEVLQLHEEDDLYG